MREEGWEEGCEECEEECGKGWELECERMLIGVESFESVSE